MKRYAFSRGDRVGGRTGIETIGAVLVTVVTLLMGCAFMFLQMVETVGQAQIAYYGSDCDPAEAVRIQAAVGNNSFPLKRLSTSHRIS
ncbi:hypothetical protein JYU10_00785 [bacterium AH-315-J04]|nr:hypothetical protein [bacterium AH-315-J04]